MTKARAGSKTPAGGRGVAALKKKPEPPSRIPPRTGAVAQPQVTTAVEMDRVGQIRTVLRAFEEGSSFDMPAKLADTMLRDDRIHGVLATRVGALVSSVIEVKPANDKQKQRKVAELLGGSDQQPGLWWKMFPRAALSELLLWGILLGIGVAEIVWDTSDPLAWKCTIRVWHPQFVRFDHQRGIYQVNTRDEGWIDLPSTEQNSRSDGRWVVYTPYGYRSPWRRALLRPLAMLYLLRGWGYRDWARYSEKHGQPVDVVEIPELAPADEKEQVMRNIASRGSESAFFFPVSDNKDAAKYSFKIVEATGLSWQGFDNLIKKLEIDIAVVILGQNLTTEISENGARAAAEVHKSVAAIKRMEDADLVAVLDEQVVSHWVEFNFGNLDLTPRSRMVVEEPDDELQEAQTLETLGTAISALKLAGVNVDVEALVAQWGIPVHAPEPGLDDEDEEAAPALDGDDAVGGSVTLTPSALSAIITVNEARAAAGLGPLMTSTGGKDPEGDLTVAEYQAKHAGTVAAAAQAEAGKEAGEEEGGEGDGEPPPQPADSKAKETADDSAEDVDEDKDTKPPKAKGKQPGKAALTRGLARVSRSIDRALLAEMSGRPSPTVAGHRRTGKYAQAVEVAARRRAAQALAVDLADLQSDIDAATSLPDLRQRLKRRYKGMNTKALGRVMERALVMANLAGRMGALEQI